MFEDAKAKTIKLLEDKSLGWLLDGVKLHLLKTKEGTGKYIKEKHQDKIYLHKDDDIDTKINALLHECGHILYLNHFSKEIKDEIKKKYLKELKEPFTVKEMLELLKGREIADFGKVRDSETISEGKWVLYLNNEDEVEIKERDTLESVFHDFASNQYVNRPWFPTRYSTKSPVEWFPEAFAYWVIGELGSEASKFISKAVNSVSKPETVGKIPQSWAVDTKWMIFWGDYVILTRNGVSKTGEQFWSLPHATIPPSDDVESMVIDSSEKLLPEIQDILHTTKDISYITINNTYIFTIKVSNMPILRDSNLFTIDEAFRIADESDEILKYFIYFESQE